MSAQRTPPGCLVAPLIALLGAASGVFAGTVFLRIEIGSFPPRPLQPLEFDASTWTDEERSTRCEGGEPTPFEPRINPYSLRRRMVDDLIATKLRPGAHRDEALALLGQSFRWPLFDTCRWFGAEDQCWYLGASESEYDYDSVWLVLDFDQGDRLLRASIVPESAAD
jgi:hypothetical protein